ncbi:hypothetical protein HK097_010239 [Rhizophlyctis rosea]|uniref:Uncharacterized protein n=1 Tax=Rhizophlyctis rosea TaxID=64517 RepID=A0AAD5SA43_9FUNG|nr:hypothetical protein HK097_010239 [Rhizophlyctis rosea]
MEHLLGRIANSFKAWKTSYDRSFRKWRTRRLLQPPGQQQNLPTPPGPVDSTSQQEKDQAPGPVINLPQQENAGPSGSQPPASAHSDKGKGKPTEPEPDEHNDDIYNLDDEEPVEVTADGYTIPKDSDIFGPAGPSKNNVVYLHPAFHPVKDVHPELARVAGKYRVALANKTTLIEPAKTELIPGTDRELGMQGRQDIINCINGDLHGILSLGRDYTWVSNSRGKALALHDERVNNETSRKGSSMGSLGDTFEENNNDPDPQYFNKYADHLARAHRKGEHEFVPLLSRFVYVRNLAGSVEPSEVHADVDLRNEETLAESFYRGQTKKEKEPNWVLAARATAVIHEWSERRMDAFVDNVERRIPLRDRRAAFDARMAAQGNPM